jgi:hypothetical protein
MPIYDNFQQKISDAYNKETKQMNDNFDQQEKMNKLAYGHTQIDVTSINPNHLTEDEYIRRKNFREGFDFVTLPAKKVLSDEFENTRIGVSKLDANFDVQQRRNPPNFEQREQVQIMKYKPKPEVVSSSTGTSLEEKSTKIDASNLIEQTPTYIYTDKYFNEPTNRLYLQDVQPKLYSYSVRYGTVRYSVHYELNHLS